MSLPDLVRLDADTFAPILKEDLTREPPFIITKPLQIEDFAEDAGFATAFLQDLNTVIINIAGGFHGPDAPLNPSAVLNREQWLRSVAQIITAIQQGAQHNYETSDVNNPYAGISQEEINALHELACANRNLATFFTKDRVKGPTNSNQCVRCLQVSGITVT